MKLFIKILLFVLVALVANVKVTSAAITFTDIPETTTSFSFQNETSETIYKVIKNDLANCCQSEQHLVTYRERGIGVGAVAAKGGEDLAFGLRSNLNEFSQATGFKNYRQFTSGGFQKGEIQSAIQNSSSNLHFNLTDFSRYKYLKFDPAGPISHGNITNWELHTIYNTPGALQRTTFYNFLNGSYQTVPKPF